VGIKIHWSDNNDEPSWTQVTQERQSVATALCSQARHRVIAHVYLLFCLVFAVYWLTYFLVPARASLGLTV